MSKLNVPSTIERLQKPLQAYTLASAIRKKPCDVGLSSTKLNRNHSPFGLNERSLEVKEVAKKGHEIPYRHTGSHLPMRMVVSKMATRKPIQDNYEIPKKEINLSLYRSYKLSPPPWQNIRKSNPSYKFYPRKFKKMVESMKNKYDHVKYSDSINLNENAKSELKKLVCNISNQGPNGWNELENNYNTLYKSQMTNKNNQSTTILDEDPFGFDSIENTIQLQQSCKSTLIGQTEIEQGCKFENVELNRRLASTGQSENDPKFVWNPVLVPCASKRPLFPTLVSGGVSLPNKQPSCFDSPCSLSSSSSGHTIAEERLCFTYFTKPSSTRLYKSPTVISQPSPDYNTFHQTDTTGSPYATSTYIEE